MADDEKKITEGEFTPAKINEAYMNRLFCSTKERVGYILYKSFGATNLGKYDIGGDIWLYKIYDISPTGYAKAQAGLGIYDMINDPLSAAIIDNLRTRWGKFKPFQYLAMLPNVATGLITCLLPLIAMMMGFDQGKRLLVYMIICYINETVAAFFGGGGYIENVFTPNPNERTSLNVSANFVSDLMKKAPQQIFGVLVDLIENGVLKGNLTTLFVGSKTAVWVIATIPTIYWYFVSKERVPQSEQPPNPIKGILSVFRNKPLLIYTLTGFIGGIDIGTGEDLYYNDVLKFNSLPSIAGIPGSPVSYASYGFVPKFREKFSTKALYIMKDASILFSETLFFLVGCIGGKKKGLYLNRVAMTITFAIGNMVEMVFYATKGIIEKEINYEVLDYCEWKNGYRVEATINLISGYFTKVRNILLRILNAWLLEKWGGYQTGVDVVQTDETKWRLFVIAFGPRLIFNALAIIPMFFYNIDKKTRELMYIELERARAERAAETIAKADGTAEVNE